MNDAVPGISVTRPAFRWWPPFYQWSVRRRLVMAHIVTAMAWTMTSAAWTMTGSGGARAGEVALSDAKARLANAQRQVSELPALRKAAQAASSASPHGAAHSTSPADPAGDIRFLSQLATKTGVTLLSMEPGAENRKEPSAGHFLKLTAQADFIRLNDFLRQLRTLPMLVVPAQATIRRDGDKLSMSAMLQLFDELRTPAFTAENIAPEPLAGKLVDPFILPSGDEPGSMALRLAGVIEDGTHAIALMETPDGMQTVKRGDALGGERVARVGMPTIVLSRGAAMRTLTWDEESRGKNEESK